MNINDVINSLELAISKEDELSEDTLNALKTVYDNLLPYKKHTSLSAHDLIYSGDILLGQGSNPYFDNIELAKFLLIEAEKTGTFLEDLLKVVSRENTFYLGGLNDKEWAKRIFDSYFSSVDQTNFTALVNASLLAAEYLENLEIATNLAKELEKRANGYYDHARLLSVYLKLGDLEKLFNEGFLDKCIDLAEGESALYELQGDIQDLVGEYDYGSGDFSPINNQDAYKAWLKIKNLIEKNN